MKVIQNAVALLASMTVAQLASAQSCTSDTDTNGVIDVQDLLNLLSEFGTDGCEAADCPTGGGGPKSVGFTSGRRASIDSWTPRGEGATCEDLRSQGATGVGCWANEIDQANAAEVDDMRWEISPWSHWGDVGAGITLDGDLGDWNGVMFKSQTPFRPCDKVGGEPCSAPFVEYDVCVACVSRATWYGPLDHSEATAFTWTPGALWAAMNVADDTHQNPGSGWNGDTVQIMFTNAARPQGGTAKTGEIQTDAGMILYNYGLKDDGGAYTRHHETHPCIGETVDKAQHIRALICFCNN